MGSHYVNSKGIIMFFRKNFLVYLPQLNVYYIIKARDESTAATKLINAFRLRIEDIQGYKFIKNVSLIK